MTYPSYAIARAVFLVALTAVGLAVPACGSSTCNCPLGGGDTVTLPGVQSQTVTVSSDDPACYGRDNGSGQPFVYRTGPGTCHFLATLANGDTYAFSVEFRETTIGNDCQCVVSAVVDASVPELVTTGDGGTN